jgi:rubrerythrin
MDLLNIETLLDFAVQMEEMGETFYMNWAEKADSKSLQIFLHHMAQEEREHKTTFENLKKEAAKILPELPETQEEYREHFKTVSQQIIFNQQEIDRVKNLPAAIELAKKQELDAQLFYGDLRKYMALEHQPIIDKIIQQEVDHLTQLEKIQLGNPKKS